MGIGLAGMGGAAGAGDALATLFKQRMDAAEFQQRDEHFKAQQAQQDALTRLKAQEQADAIAQRLELAKQAQTDRADAAKHLNLTRIDAQLKEIPTDTPLSQPTVAGMTDAGITPERFSPTPIRPDQSAAGSVADTAPPASIAAPDQPPPMPGTVANSPMPGRVSFTRIPTAQELQHQQDEAQKNAPKPVMRIGRDGGMEQIGQAPAGAHFATEPAPPKEAQQHFTPLPQYGDNGQPLPPMAFDLNTGTARAIPGVGSNKAAPGAAQAAQHDIAKKEALGSLDQLDQAIDAAKDFIGPGAGRVSSVQQMVGNQDPAIQALGTKMLLAKMQVDHAATGTVRAGASPQLLSRWDNILSQKVTPEGLKASVQAMREILGGGATGGTVKMQAPDGRSLSVPAEKVKELEALGATRVP